MLSKAITDPTNPMVNIRLKDLQALLSATQSQVDLTPIVPKQDDQTPVLEQKIAELEEKNHTLLQALAAAKAPDSPNIDLTSPESIKKSVLFDAVTAAMEDLTSPDLPAINCVIFNDFKSIVESKLCFPETTLWE